MLDMDNLQGDVGETSKTQENKQSMTLFVAGIKQASRIHKFKDIRQNGGYQRLGKRMNQKGIHGWLY